MARQQSDSAFHSCCVTQPAIASFILAGGQLLVTTEEGDLILVAASPEKLRELARVPAVDGERC